jgi:hypothetical protein
MGRRTMLPFWCHGRTGASADGRTAFGLAADMESCCVRDDGDGISCEMATIAARQMIPARILQQRLVAEIGDGDVVFGGQLFRAMVRLDE